MGTINHNVVIATTWKRESVLRVWKWINDLPTPLGNLFIDGGEQDTYGFHTTVMLPDGSKEGWDDSNQGNEIREQFINQLKLDDYEDGSSPWAWVEVGFGEYGQKVLRGNCQNEYDDREYGG